MTVDAVVAQLLRDNSSEMAAAVGALLERTVLRVGRDGGDASRLVSLRERVALELTARVGRDAASHDREYKQGLGKRIIGCLQEGRRSPSELARLLDVDISQISRASRVLVQADELMIEVDPLDRRRRMYRAVSRGRRPVFPLPVSRRDRIRSPSLDGG